MTDLRWNFDDVDAVFAFDLTKILTGWDKDERAGVYRGFKIRWSGFRPGCMTDLYLGWWVAYSSAVKVSIVSPILGPVQEREEFEEIQITPQPGQMALTGRYLLMEAKAHVLRQMAIALEKLFKFIDDKLGPPTEGTVPPSA